MRKGLQSREYSRKEAEYWRETNALNERQGKPIYTLERMLESAWKKGYEAGQRITRQRNKESKNDSTGTV